MIDRQWAPGHEGALGQAGPLCVLYEGLHRARARSGIQIAGCVARRHREGHGIAGFSFEREQNAPVAEMFETLRLHVERRVLL